MSHSKIVAIAVFDFEKYYIIPGCGSAWLERLIWDQEAAGSNPVTPIFAGVVQW